MDRSLVYATGHLSGAHINPAVTLAFALTRHFPAAQAAAYIGAQAVGATGAAFLLLAIWPDQPARARRHRPDRRGRERPGLRGGADRLADVRGHGRRHRHPGRRFAAAIAIGGTVGLGALLGGPVTGASMNPARSLGPALAAGEWTDFWIYLAGPLVGAAAGALAYQAVRGHQQAPDAEPAGQSDGASPLRLPA